MVSWSSTRTKQAYYLLISFLLIPEYTFVFIICCEPPVFLYFFFKYSSSTFLLRLLIRRNPFSYFSNLFATCITVFLPTLSWLHISNIGIPESIYSAITILLPILIFSSRVKMLLII